MYVSLRRDLTQNATYDTRAHTHTRSERVHIHTRLCMHGVLQRSRANIAGYAGVVRSGNLLQIRPAQCPSYNARVINVAKAHLPLNVYIVSLRRSGKNPVS